MGYSNYKKIGQVASKFKLENRLGEIFPKIKPVRPSNWLKETLHRAYEMPLTTEKAKAERAISPVLSEVGHWYGQQICLFSGEDLTVNPADDLSGPCDFFFGLHPPKLTLDAPIVSLVEAKDEDMEWGMAQCAAQMYAASLFNKQSQNAVDVIFGCACTDKEWRFLKLEDSLLTIDREPLTEISMILGAWKRVFAHYGLE